MKPVITKYLKNSAFWACIVLVLFISTTMPLSVAASSTGPQISSNVMEAANLQLGSWGTGADGNLAVTAAFNINVNTQVAGRTCADAPAYSVIGLSASSAQVSPNPTYPLAACFKTGDEVLLINMQGNFTKYGNVGRYEFLRVISVASGLVNFTTPKTGFYGTDRNDVNIGIGTGQQRVMLMRVPNYNNVSVNHNLTGNAWDGFKFGVVAFRVKGVLTGGGVIHANAKGYRGDALVSGEQNCGESYAGVSWWGGGCGGGGMWGGVHRVAQGAGGAYATNGGASGVGVGGTAYGVRSLSALYPGSAGGWSGCKDGDNTCIDNGSGGNGGGVVYVSASSINFAGSVKSEGAVGADNGGGGAGGSIRIEAGIISKLASSAVGAPRIGDKPAGGQGRIAVFYQTSSLSPASGPANPHADVQQFFAAPAATPTRPVAPIDWGTGADGVLTVMGGDTFNIHLDSETRNCIQGGDAVSYNVTALTSTFAQVSVAPLGDCLRVGDEFLLINLQGSSAKYINTGLYEFMRVASLAGNQVNFNRAKTNFYGESASNDVNIGIAAGQQRVVLMRVPNYERVTVNGKLTGAPWDGLKHGVVAFRVRNTLSGIGSLNVSGLGYRFNPKKDSDCAESYNSFGRPCLGAGESGGHTIGDSAGGGAYGTDGATRGRGLGGVAYGTPDLTRLYPGSAGGNNLGSVVPLNFGGGGGGILYALANKIDFAGSIVSNGMDRSGGAAGSGAGGSIRLEAYDVARLANVSAVGGPGNLVDKAAGGDGRIAIYYWKMNISYITLFPSAFFKTISPNAPTPTPTITAIPTGNEWGTGADGDLSILAGATFNLNANTNITSRAACPDGIAYNVLGLTAMSAQVPEIVPDACFKPGDEVLLINMQGTSVAPYRFSNVGRYEFLYVSSVVDKQINFIKAKTKFYGANDADDSNIGVNPNQQRVMLMRVPNYNNVTLNGSLIASDWDGLKFGMVAFRVKGSLMGVGTINMSANGYRGKVSGKQPCGESYVGLLGCYGGGMWGGEDDTAFGSGGGYGAPGDSFNTRVGGRNYGAQSLNTLFHGSAGGWSGCENGSANCLENGSGGNGGGIVYIAANSISLTGKIQTDGAVGVLRGGGGAGGSIRIEANNITKLVSSALGGGGITKGGKGRIAIYYRTGPIGITSNPYPDIHQTFVTAPVTPTPPPAPLNWGNGADGTLIVVGGQTYNINSESQTRNCFQGGDAVSYSVTNLTSTYAQISVALVGDCIRAGDELLLINLQGATGKFANTGRYEFLRVASAAGAKVTFTKAKVNFYGEAVNSDANIGVAAGQQRVMIMRVPNYEKVTINGVLTGTGWDGLKHGLVVFRVRGLLSGIGTIQMSNLGYRGTNTGGIYCGESYTGFGTPCLGSGKWGGETINTSGGGGAYGTNGATITSPGGVAYGVPNLSKLLPGSAGGHSTSALMVYPGGSGGGMVYILADTINFTGKIANNGSGAGAYAGSGAGGSIRVEAGSIIKLTANAVGGPGYLSQRAAGGVGRIAIYSLNLTNGGLSASPAAFLGSLTLNPTATPTLIRTLTPTKTSTRTSTPTLTATEFFTSTVTSTPTVTAPPVDTSTPTETLTPAETGTITPTGTVTLTPTITSTETVTLTPTVTPTQTITLTLTRTNTPTVTVTLTRTKTATAIPNPITFTSIGAEDGHVVETSETSGLGGTFVNTGGQFFVGDNAANAQIRNILSFDTSALPDNATIQSATLRVKHWSFIGTDLLTISNLFFDIVKGKFGTSYALEAVDFQAAASASSVAYFPIGTLPSVGIDSATSGWYTTTLNATGRSFISLNDKTQFRMRFGLDDNNDLSADYIKFYSGDYPSGNHPELIISYTVP